MKNKEEVAYYPYIIGGKLRAYEWEEPEYPWRSAEIDYAAVEVNKIRKMLYKEKYAEWEKTEKKFKNVVHIGNWSIGVWMYGQLGNDEVYKLVEEGTLFLGYEENGLVVVTKIIEYDDKGEKTITKVGN